VSRGQTWIMARRGERRWEDISKVLTRETQEVLWPVLTILELICLALRSQDFVTCFIVDWAVLLSRHQHIALVVILLSKIKSNPDGAAQSGIIKIWFTRGKVGHRFIHCSSGSISSCWLTMRFPNLKPGGSQLLNSAFDATGSAWFNNYHCTNRDDHHLLLRYGDPE
jgi:hypothetical protein